MAFPTVAQCNTAAQARVADVSADIYTAALLLPGIQAAVRKLFRKFQNFDNPRIIKTVFYPVAAYTSVIAPATAGINDMGEPIALYERGNFSTVNVSAVSGTTSPAITTSTHGRATGDFVTLNQLGGLTGAEGMFAATATSPTVLTINGLVVVGTYTSGGTVGYSADRFRGPLPSFTDRLALPSDVTIELRGYVWQGDRFYITPSSVLRELAIDYYSSATVPTGDADVIGIDDCVDYIAAEALAVVCATRAPQIAEVQGVLAAEALKDLITGAVRTLQLEDQDSRARMPFRSRNDYTSSWADYFIG